VVVSKAMTAATTRSNVMKPTWDELLSRPCIECGGRRTRAKHSGGLSLGSSHTFLGGRIEVRAAVCIECGYVAFYAEEPERLTR